MSVVGIYLYGVMSLLDIDIQSIIDCHGR